MATFFQPIIIFYWSNKDGWCSLTTRWKLQYFKMPFDNISRGNLHFIFTIFIQWMYMMFSLSVITRIFSGFLLLLWWLLLHAVWIIVFFLLSKLLFVLFYVTVWWCSFNEKCKCLEFSKGLIEIEIQSLKLCIFFTVKLFLLMIL